MGSDAGRAGLRHPSRLAACLAALASICAAPAQPASLPGLRGGARTPADLDHGPFRALLRVQTELGTRCTGFLVAPAVAMTAAHCLYLPRTGGFLQPGSVHVLLGYRAGSYRAHARVVRFVIADGYEPTQPARTLGHDRAVLVLDHPIADASATLPPAAAPDPPVAVRVAGYDQDRAEIALESPPCQIRSLGRDASGSTLLDNDCSVTHGASGAPLIIDLAGRVAVIGLIAAGAAATTLAVPIR